MQDNHRCGGGVVMLTERRRGQSGPGHVVPLVIVFMLFCNVRSAPAVHPTSSGL
jgi:hypothetical protein